jgi:hypothetical protein
MRISRSCTAAGIGVAFPGWTDLRSGDVFVQAYARDDFDI